MCVCLYIYMCVFIDICVCVCVYIYIYIYIYIYVCVCVFIYIYIYVCVCVCLYIYICVCVCLYISLRNKKINKYIPLWIYFTLLSGSSIPSEELGKSVKYIYNGIYLLIFLFLNDIFLSISLFICLYIYYKLYIFHSNWIIPFKCINRIYWYNNILYICMYIYIYIYVCEGHSINLVNFVSGVGNRKYRLQLRIFQRNQ